MRQIHPVFHISVLEPATPNTIPERIPDPAPPVEIDGEPEYEIEAILDTKVDFRRTRCPLQYLVQWFGYPGHPQEKEWLPATELEHAQELVAEFHKAHPDALGPEIPVNPRLKK